MISKTAIIYPDVILGKNAEIEDYCIIGQPFTGYSREQTVIGDNAVIRSHSVIYAGNIIGNNFQTGHKTNIRELNQIGDDVSVGTLSVIEHHVTIENDVRIHTQAFIPEFSTLCEGAWIGPNVVLTNAKYPRSPDVKRNLQGPKIGRHARIGANATILPGIEIGERALIGAGSVVTNDVPAERICYGNPAVCKGIVDY